MTCANFAVAVGVAEIRLNWNYASELNQMQIVPLWPVGLIVASAFFVPLNLALAQTGSVSGTLILDGEVPKLPPSRVKGANVCGADAVPDQTFVVHPQTKGLANVFIWVQPFDKDGIPAEYRDPKSPIVEIDSKSCQFVPHCVIAMEGQELVMKNADAVEHHVHVSALRGNVINDLIAPNDRHGVKRRLKADLMPIPVKCDIHPWMLSHILILDHPYAALSNEEGKFTIEGLPEGTYDFRVWHESQGYVRIDTKGIEVKAGKATDLGTLKVAPE